MCSSDLVQFAGEPYEFNFSKFARHRYDKELPNEDLIIERIAFIDVPPNDLLHQYMEEHENDMFIQEREKIDEVFFRQPAILKHDLPVESLGTPTPPKRDPIFELKLSQTLSSIHI